MTTSSNYTRPPPSATAQRSHRGHDPYDGLEPTLDRMTRLDTADPDRAGIREEAIGRCLPLADHIARRYAGRGVDFEDLLQIARMGAVCAVDRYDPARGRDFLAFAVPTILGEVRRYFRDQGWAVRIPRRLQELQARINHLIPELAQDLGHLPTARELATALATTVEEITQAMVAANGFRCDSLDAPAADGDENVIPVAADRHGDIDPNYGLLEDAATVRPLLAELPAADRRILALYFYENKTQNQIGNIIGCSQMHVSRTLNRILTTLRHQALPGRSTARAA